MTIGERAAQAIREKAKEKGIPIYKELENIGTQRNAFHVWEKCNIDPSGYFLQQMALNGYDIYWILTGKEQEHGCEV